MEELWSHCLHNKWISWYIKKLLDFSLVPHRVASSGSYFLKLLTNGKITQNTVPWTQNGCKCLELTWIPSSHNCWKYLPAMLRTMRASWPIARTTANQKSATPGTRNLRGKEKRISSEKHQGTDSSGAEHWSTGPVEGRTERYSDTCGQSAVAPEWHTTSQGALTTLLQACPHTHTPSR